MLLTETRNESLVRQIFGLPGILVSHGGVIGWHVYVLE